MAKLIRKYKNVRIATIMDSFSYESFKDECKLFQLSKNNWQAEIDSFKPELLFVESAWHGHENQWCGVMDSDNSELVLLAQYCQTKGIPTCFWSKDDPVFFDMFLGSAKHFDHIFTTDLDCIPRYREQLAKTNVHLLTFCAQPANQHPIESTLREDAVSFAGAYYHAFSERGKDFRSWVDALTGIKPFSIFDRNHHGNCEALRFPDEYQKYIVGYLPAEQIDEAYKKYRFSLNLNTVKESPTMFSRRVYQLLASNTLILSNPSLGMKMCFGDLVFAGDNANELRKMIRFLDQNPTYTQKTRLLGLRKVLFENTSEDRLGYILNITNQYAADTSLPFISVIGIPKNQMESESIVSSYQRQTYKHKELILLEHSDPRKSLRVNELLSTQDRPLHYVAAFETQDYYGPNYLMDLGLATRYSAADVIGKKSFYSYFNDSFVESLGNEYKEVGSLLVRASMINLKSIASLPVSEYINRFASGEYAEDHCLSIDPFNYCQNYHCDTCMLVDDLGTFDTGLRFSAILHP